MVPIRPIESFTGLRGLAALWVVAYHYHEPVNGVLPGFAAQVLTSGYLAVDLFFILSGFVIALNYGSICQDLRFRGARHFLLSRFARLYPVHLVMSLLFLVNPVSIMLLSTAKDVGNRYGIGYFLLSLVLAQNWGMTSRIEWNIPAWSISVEWFAYLMFPLLLPLMAGVGDRAGVLLVKVVLMLSVLAAFFWMAGARSIGATIPQLGLSRCLLEFMLGVGLCLIYGITGAPGKAKQLVLVALAAVAAIATASLHLPDFMLIPAAFALLIFSMIGEATPLYRHLSCRPFLWLGEISYSLYMAHYFVRDWVKFAAGDKANPAIFLLYMALAVAAGILLHRLVERPGRQLFRRFTLRSA